MNLIVEKHIFPSMYWPANSKNFPPFNGRKLCHATIFARRSRLFKERKISHSIKNGFCQTNFIFHTFPEVSGRRFLTESQSWKFQGILSYNKRSVICNYSSMSILGIDWLIVRLLKNTPQTADVRLLAEQSKNLFLFHYICRKINNVREVDRKDDR